MLPRTRQRLIQSRFGPTAREEDAAIPLFAADRMDGHDSSRAWRYGGHNRCQRTDEEPREHHSLSYATLHIPTLGTIERRLINRAGGGAPPQIAQEELF
jgi:hypothetical protein